MTFGLVILAVQVCVLATLARDKWWVQESLPAKKRTGSGATVITVWVVIESDPVPLSVAVKVTVTTKPPWPEMGVQVNVPEVGFPGTLVKVAPAGRPVAVSVTFSFGSRVSAPVTVKVRVVPTAALPVGGAVMVGGLLTTPVTVTL
jgi:hypothetical protein